MSAESKLNSDHLELNDFAIAVKNGLSKKNKTISSKYLYDDRGSELFVKITQLEEYYLTGCEYEILEKQSSEIVSTLQGVIAEVVELGSGDGHKTELFLKEIVRSKPSITFAPVDINQSSVDIITDRIKSTLPQLKINGFTGDYFEFLAKRGASSKGNKIFLFLGSNIGNFTPEETVGFFNKVGKYLKKGDYFLVGVDLKKNIKAMENAYNDSKGVTAEFNYNLLDRMNHELGADFAREKFYHHGVYNPQVGAMQSFLISKIPQDVHIKKLDLKVHFDKLEPIHIENSYKYSEGEIVKLANSTGYEVVENFFDHRQYFMDSLWQKK